MQEKFNQLRESYMTARSNKEKDEIFKQLTEFIAQNPDESYDAMLSGLQSLNREIKGLMVRDEIADVLSVVQSAYIAKNYFGKSAGWFSQRLNGSKVGSGRVFFSHAEIVQLQDAIRDIGKKLSEFTFSDELLKHS